MKQRGESTKEHRKQATTKKPQMQGSYSAYRSEAEVGHWAHPKATVYTGGSGLDAHAQTTYY